ncbi:hypothetical protein [Argonema galeatum]|uniref:hypothetical protein n=1 Tax=Argonema galeatum TaxID=2942762 RepID=UPI0020127298|nr:hypothetical protein [Argonema galeatum]MCL1468941.1 hypothetical protein [Argonema galeatum A003/A1]
MTQPSMSEGELAKMTELLELAKITEHKMKELADFTLQINQKYEKRLAEFRVAKKLGFFGSNML